MVFLKQERMKYIGVGCLFLSLLSIFFSEVDIEIRPRKSGRYYYYNSLTRNATDSSSNRSKSHARFIVTDTDNVTDNVADTDNDPRPSGLRIFMMGDSLTRYHYMSMTYFLLHKTWINMTIQPNPVNEKTYRTGWEQYFRETTTPGIELCDCFRDANLGFDWVIENRYFYEPQRDNMVVYMQFMIKPQGRIDPTAITKQLIQNYQYKFVHPNVTKSIWSYQDWASLIRHQAGKLQPKPHYAIINGGIWGTQFQNESSRQDLLAALNETGIRGVWRTTTWPRGKDRPASTWAENRLVATDFREHGHLVLDAHWTRQLPSFVYWNDNHPWEPVYRILTEEAFEMMGHRFPKNYEKIDRNRILPSPTDTESQQGDASSPSSSTSSSTAVPEANRPHGLRLAVLGDSLSRFQYLSLAYFLARGKWFGPLRRPNLMSENFFNNGERDFFNFAQKQLDHSEYCDCSPKEGQWELSVENRFFWHRQTNNTLTYLRNFGDTTAPFQGRVFQPPSRHPFVEGIDAVTTAKGPQFEAFTTEPMTNISEFTWRYHGWDEVLIHVLAKLEPRPTHVVFNAGVNPIEWDAGGSKILDALDTLEMKGIWRTTTYQKNHRRKLLVLQVDNVMAGLFRSRGHWVLNTSWTQELDPMHFWTMNHFYEPVYRVMNEELLNMLGYKFPVGEPLHYQTIKRTNLTPLSQVNEDLLKQLM